MSLAGQLAATAERLALIGVIIIQETGFPQVIIRDAPSLGPARLILWIKHCPYSLADKAVYDS